MCGGNPFLLLLGMLTLQHLVLVDFESLKMTKS
jgi:hypothetical protein